MSDTERQSDPNPVQDILRPIMERINKMFADMTPEERAERERQVQANRKSYDAQRIEEIMARSNAPLRQRRKHPALDDEWGHAFNTISAKLGTGFLITICGITGTGKTQIAVELIRKMAQDFKQSQFCSAMQFFMDVKRAYAEETSEAGVIYKYCQHPLLVIDEVGKRSESDWENRLLYEMLNRRYQNCQDTLLMSNHDAATVEAALGASLVSRMKETGGIIECNWESFR